MSAHTPGPWEVDDDDWVETVPGSSDMRRGFQAPGVTEEETAANARLIAAAPTMLDALLEAEAALEQAVARLKTDWPDATERVGLRIVREAIAKARATPRETGEVPDGS